MRDLVIVLPGITGSVLSRDGKDLWAPSAGAMWRWLTTLGDSVRGLALPAQAPGSAAPDDGVLASRVIRGFHGVFGIGKIDGYSALVNTVTESFNVKRGRLDAPDGTANFLEFPYDWRRSNRESARALEATVEIHLHAWRTGAGGPEARVILLAHSMGGLVSRYWLEVLEGWRDCRALFTFGTPYRGSLDALGFVANGYKKALLDLGALLRSLPSVYELMPIYPVVHADGDWHRVAECKNIPGVDPARARDALVFHREIEDAVKRHENDPDYLRQRYHIFPFVGVSQPTRQSAVLRGGALTVGEGHPSVVPAVLEGGDGTVPRVSATPIELSGDYRETFFVERHAALQNNDALLDDVRERLKQLQAAAQTAKIRGKWLSQERQAKRPSIGLSVDDLYLPSEPVTVGVRAQGVSSAAKLVLSLKGEHDTASQQVDVSVGEDEVRVPLEGLTAGRYRVTMRSKSAGPAAPTPVHDVFEVAG